jgi:hypothetical protein
LNTRARHAARQGAKSSRASDIFCDVAIKADALQSLVDRRLLNTLLSAFKTSAADT